jgi:hypothetical protein
MSARHLGQHHGRRGPLHVTGTDSRTTSHRPFVVLAWTPGEHWCQAHARYKPGPSPPPDSTSAVPQLKPGHRPPATPSPPPPRGQPRHQPKPPAAFRVTVSGARLRHPGTAPIGDLDANHAVPGRDGNGDRLAGQTRSAIEHAVAEKLTYQQDSDIPARVPWAKHRAYERAGDPRPLRPPGKRHALPDRRPSHQRTRPSPPAPGRSPGRRADTQGMHAQLSGARQAGTRR